MNLWIRLICYFFTTGFRPRLSAPADASILDLRVLPLDLDLSLHMNNGRYLTLMDIGRLDFMVRTGLWRAVVRHRWTPIATAIAIRYRRELRFLERFRLETRLLAWDAQAVVMEQVFVFSNGPREGQVAARALFKGGLYDRREKRFVPITRLMSEINVSAVSPPASAEVDAFLKADNALKQSGAGPTVTQA